MIMKKRMIATVMIVALMAGTIMGCGASQTAGNEKQTSEKIADTTTAAETKTDSDKKVAMLYGASINDGGWGASCYQAMCDAAEAYGYETAYTENVDTSEYVSVLTGYADLGYDLIFAPGSEYSDAVKQVAEQYPDVKFCLLNGTFSSDNVVSVMPDAEQIGYLAGALAGLMTKTGYIGFIGGMELDTTKTKLEAYEAAAKVVNPDVNVTSGYAGDYYDAAKGKEIASSMMSTYDVDVLFGDAGAVDTGAREALAESDGHYSIGQPGDLGSADDKVIICSVVTDNAALVEQCMQAIEDGTFGNTTIYGTVENGCLSVGTFSSQVPEDIKTQYLEYVEQIKNGTFISK
jgi:basic membrane protein A